MHGTVYQALRTSCMQRHCLILLGTALRGARCMEPVPVGLRDVGVVACPMVTLQCRLLSRVEHTHRFSSIQSVLPLAPDSVLCPGLVCYVRAILVYVYFPWFHVS